MHNLDIRFANAIMVSIGGLPIDVGKELSRLCKGFEVNDLDEESLHLVPSKVTYHQDARHSMNLKTYSLWESQIYQGSQRKFSRLRKSVLCQGAQFLIKGSIDQMPDIFIRKFYHQRNDTLSWLMPTAIKEKAHLIKIRRKNKMV
jgi:hypothetical protein